VNPETLAEHVKLTVTPDKLAAELHVDAEVPAGVVDEGFVLALAQGVGLAINQSVHQSIANAVEVLKKPRAEMVRIKIASATAPVHGEPGYIEFLPGFDPLVAGRAQVDYGDHPSPARGSGGVDHYHKFTFTLVPSNGEIAKIHQPSTPEDGQDVMGGVIAARLGKQVQVVADDTIIIQPDGRVFAARPGVVDWQDPKLRMLRMLKLPGNIDFSTGNINFPGSVVVAKAVRDHFKVAAAGDVLVNGQVEGAALSAGRDARLEGGMAGKETGTLDVGRDLNARYLNNTTVSIGRDLTVDKELVNTRAVVGRNFLGRAASITGGKIIFGGSVEVFELGSQIGVATELVLGSIPEIEKVIGAGEEMLPQLIPKRDKLEQQIQPLRKFAGKISAAEIERLCELEHFERELTVGIKSLQSRLETLKSMLQTRSAVDLTVHGRIYPKVLILAGNYTIDFYKTCLGPVRIGLSASAEPEMISLHGEQLNLADYARVRKIDGSGQKKAA